MTIREEVHHYSSHVSTTLLYTTLHGIRHKGFVTNLFTGSSF